MKALVIALASCALLATPALADGFQNGSFEQGSFVGNGDNTDSLGVGSTAMTGWTVVNGSVSWIGTPDPFSVHVKPGNGSYFLDLTDYRDSPPFGGVQQTFDIFQGHSYQVSFDLGSSSDYGLPVSLEASVAGLTFDFSSTATGTNNWETETFTFDSGDLASVTLALVGTSGRANIGLDNVVVTDLGRTQATGDVPEPSSWAMLLAGFGSVGACLRRGRRQALQAA